MAKQNSGVEQRRFVRVAEEDVLVCEPFDASVFGGVSRRRAHVFTKDLSEGGLLFESAEVFSIGTILKLQVDIPDWEKYKTEFHKVDALSGRLPLIVLGRVVRVEDIGEGMFDIGVVFAALDDGHKRALRRYLEKTVKNGIKTLVKR